MRKFCVFLLLVALSAGCLDRTEGVAASYSRYSNAKHGFGLGLNTAHRTPGNGEAVDFPKYNALYYVKTKKKKMYLTFDCGYENGHTKTILDTLKKHGQKQSFL